MESCFADKEGRCLALKEKECLGCEFFKTEEQLVEELVALRQGGYELWKKVHRKYE